jgi:hypothetical protein
MAKTIKQFTYSVTKMGRADVPVNPWVHIELQHWGTREEGAPVISPDLVTSVEIDEHIRALKEDLDAVGAAAKHALTKAQDFTRETVMKRSS